MQVRQLHTGRGEHQSASLAGGLQRFCQPTVEHSLQANGSAGYPRPFVQPILPLPQGSLAACRRQSSLPIAQRHRHPSRCSPAEHSLQESASAEHLLSCLLPHLLLQQTSLSASVQQGSRLPQALRHRHRQLSRVSAAHKRPCKAPQQASQCKSAAKHRAHAIQQAKVTCSQIGEGLQAAALRSMRCRRACMPSLTQRLGLPHTRVRCVHPHSPERLRRCKASRQACAPHVQRSQPCQRSTDNMFEHPRPAHHRQA